MSTFEWSQLATRMSALEQRQSNIDTHIEARVSALEQRQRDTDTHIEARVSALERRQSNLETSIEEVDRDATTNFNHLSYDMTASFEKLTEYLAQIEENNERRFQSIENTQGEHSQRFERIETLLTQILARLPENR